MQSEHHLQEQEVPESGGASFSTAALDAIQAPASPPLGSEGHGPTRPADGAQLQGLMDYIQRKRTFKREKIQRMDLSGTKARTTVNSRRNSPILGVRGAPKPFLLPEPVL